MPKDTFDNLNPDKKDKVSSVLKKFFQTKPFHEITVKEIVQELDIARGSFYQYFEDLEDAYFEFLNHQVVNIHKLFLQIFQNHFADLEQTLLAYGDQLAVVLFDDESSLVYRNIYLHWDESLNDRWLKSQDAPTHVLTAGTDAQRLSMEQVQFLKGIMHSLIKRNYKENWTKAQFTEIYQQYVTWIIGGMN